jgi:hypothetical protein
VSKQLEKAGKRKKHFHTKLFQIQTLYKKIIGPSFSSGGRPTHWPDFPLILTRNRPRILEKQGFQT